jgi:hypothetical protein
MRRRGFIEDDQAGPMPTRDLAARQA